MQELQNITKEEVSRIYNLPKINGCKKEILEKKLAILSKEWNHNIDQQLDYYAELGYIDYLNSERNDDLITVWEPLGKEFLSKL